MLQHEFSEKQIWSVDCLIIAFSWWSNCFGCRWLYRFSRNFTVWKILTFDFQISSQLPGILSEMADVKPSAVGLRWTLPWIKPVISSLRFRGTGRSSFISSQNRSNCLGSGLVTALICLATSSDVTGVLKLLVALLTSSDSWPFRLWVSSPVSPILTLSTIGVFNSVHKILAWG